MKKIAFAVPMRVLLLCCALGAGSAADLFDDELYRAALQPALCARQLAGMRRADFYDASFRTPEGLLAGNLASLGNYHQCLAINQDFPGSNIQGKYCLVQAPLTSTVRIPSFTGVSASENVTWTEVTLPEDLIQIHRVKSLSLAVCVPKACSVEAVLAPYTAHSVVGFNYTEQYCRLPHDKPFAAADYVAVVIFSVLGVLTLLSTAYEIRHIFILGKDPEQANACLRICSVYSNTRRLLSFGNPRTLDCLDGIRSLSILVIIVFHTFAVYFSFVSKASNKLYIHQWLRTKQAIWLISGDIAVDSFLTLSALLLVYTSVNKMTPATLLQSLPWFYLNRFLRLFPLLAAAVLLQASLLHHAADGPGWHNIAELVGECRRYWWSALLHVQNIVNPFNLCIPQSWYLSVDMQLYLVSPLVLFWVLGSRRAAWTALAAALLASLAATLAYCYFVIYDVGIVAHIKKETSEKVHEYYKYYYFNTLMRSPQFIIGMLFGYILHVFRGQKMKLPLWVTTTCHVLSLATFCYVIYIVHPCIQSDWDNQAADIINNTFRRPAWSLALCWLIVACVHGYGGPVNWFLSLRLWKFVARISYAMYLTHYSLQEMNSAANMSPVYFSIRTLFTSFASDLVNTIVVSTVMCVLIEEPAFTLQRMLQRGATSESKRNN